MGKNLFPHFPPFCPISYLYTPCQNPIFFVCSPYILPLYRYEETTENIRRKYDPDKIRTEGEYGIEIG